MKKLLRMILAAMLILAAFAVAENGTDAAFNPIGSYMDETSQRASMKIRKNYDCAEYGVEISWANSAFETVQWSFYGDYDADTHTLPYDNCRKEIFRTDVEDPFGEFETVYEEGTGKLTFDPESGRVFWQDDREDAGKECVFSLIYLDMRTLLNGVDMPDSETKVIEALGEPASAEDTGNGRVLAYEDYDVAGVSTKVKLFFENDQLEAVLFASRTSGEQALIALNSLESDYGAEDLDVEYETVMKYANTYSEIRNPECLNGSAYRLHEGTLMMVIYNSDTSDADLLCLSAAAQD